MRTSILPLNDKPGDAVFGEMVHGTDDNFDWSSILNPHHSHPIRFRPTVWNSNRTFAGNQITTTIFVPHFTHSATR